MMDSKQLDLIQKLIKLANNNPNENEANLAARKVCKMLTDYKFGSVPKTAYDKVRSASNSTYNPFEEMFRDARQRAYGSPTGRNAYYKRPFEGDWARFYSPAGQSKPNEKVTRKCTYCNKDVETKSVDNPYVCGICQPIKLENERKARRQHEEANRYKDEYRDYTNYPYLCYVCMGNPVKTKLTVCQPCADGAFFDQNTKVYIFSNGSFFKETALAQIGVKIPRKTKEDDVKK